MRYQEKHEMRWRMGFRVLQWGILLAPFILFSWLLDQNYILSGRLNIRLLPNDHNQYVVEKMAKGVALMRDRAASFWSVTNDTFGFTVSVPRPFLRATVRLRYRSADPVAVDLRLRSAKNKAAAFQVPLARSHPVVEKLLRDDAMRAQWHLLRKHDVILWQRGSVYETFDDFLVNPPDPRTIRTIEYLPASNLSLPHVPEEDAISLPLSGPHTLWLYADAGQHTVTIETQELNQKSGPDRFHAQLATFSNLVVASKTIPDDGRVDANGVASPIVTEELTFDAPRPAFFTLMLDSSRDRVIHSVSVDHAQLFVTGRLVLTNRSASGRTSESYQSTTLYTNSSQLVMRTNVAAAPTTVTVGGTAVTMRNPEHRQLLRNLRGVQPVTFATYNLTMTFDGVLSSSPFPPRVLLRPFPAVETEDDLAEASYVLALYPTVVKTGDDTIAETTVEGPAALQLGTRFTVDFLVRDRPASSAPMVVTSMDVQLEKPPLTLSRAIGAFRSFIFE